ncbi:MAG: hypothetical protein ACLRS8_06855 [Parabacteroides merdae]
MRRSSLRQFARRRPNNAALETQYSPRDRPTPDDAAHRVSHSVFVSSGSFFPARLAPAEKIRTRGSRHNTGLTGINGSGPVVNREAVSRSPPPDGRMSIPVSEWAISVIMRQNSKAERP